MTPFPNGVSSFGVPVIPGPGGRYEKVLWVSSTYGKAGNPGTADRPMASLGGAQGALAKAHASKGTLIRVYRGHSEAVDSADEFSDTSANKNIDIVGDGEVTLMPTYYSERPTLTWSDAAATWLFDTVGIRIFNFNMFMAGARTSSTALTVAAPVTVSADGCGIFGCYIDCGIDADQLVTIGVTTTAAADGFRFVGNTVRGAAAATCTTFLRLVGLDDVDIAFNDIVCGTSAAAVGPIQALTTAPVNARIRNNYIRNSATNATACITGMAAMSGWISENRLRNADATSLAHIATPGNCSLSENYGVNDNGETGALLGTVSA